MRVAVEASDEVRWIRAAWTDEILPSPPDPKRFDGRSLVLIVSDALGASHLHCYGAEQETSPHLDRLAAEGARFLRAYSQTSWTTPSVTSLFSGLTQEEHGVRDVGLRLKPDIRTVAESFRARGDRTAAFVQNPILDKEIGLDRGFEDYQVVAGEGSDDVARRAVDFLRARKTGERFFVYVHLLPPHSPYTPPAPFRDRFARTSSPEIDGSQASIQRVNQVKPGPGDAPAQKLLSLYRANVAYSDSIVGSIVAELKELGLERRSVVVHTSDHGEAFAQHGYVGHNLHVFEEMVHVPLIVWAPGSAVPPGTRVSSPVSLLDLRPALEQWFGLENGDRDSRPLPWLDRVLREPARTRSRAQLLSARYLQGGPIHLAVLAHPFKWIFNPANGNGALIHLPDDPTEKGDCAPRFPLVARVLRHELEAWRLGVAPIDESLRYTLDSDEKARIEAIGYAMEDEVRSRK